ncbi:MAG: stage V sporulation protein AC [Clostridiales bacterium]|jgi:stage V sporulation protein AC|nr:stage V sporulation protein AC [Clostridiales bacterium]
MEPTLRPENYDAYIQKNMPKSNLIWDLARAFLVGGLICTLGQGLNALGMEVFKLSEDQAGMLSIVVLIFLGALLTGLGVYDVIGKFAGAGSIVPITGFANSIVAPAMEFKREGYVLGVGAKMFAIAGPVLVYGTILSVAAGIAALLF